VYDTIINAHPLRRVLIVCQSSLQTMIEAEKDEAAKEKLSENLKFIEAQVSMCMYMYVCMCMYVCVCMCEYVYV
jgi:hypothetical protein